MPATKEPLAETLRRTEMALLRYKRMYERAAEIADKYAPGWERLPDKKQGIMQFFRKDEPKSTSPLCQIPEGHCDTCTREFNCYGGGNIK